ncbi:MAG: putative lipid II flippase FtsW [Rubrobacteridae bacterium]|nr:putative lipid II flippase FtsW [Rubrobacteridae bacterium]
MSSTKATAKRKIVAKSANRKNYYWLIGTVYVMILFGLVMILSASSVRAYTSMGDSYYYIKKQLLSLGIGSLFLLICFWIPTKRIQAFAPYAVFTIIGLLVAVLIPGIGKEVDGASRWISIAGFRLQPSEFAKIVVIIFTADYLARRKNMLGDIRELIYPYGFIVGLIVFLVMKQPDLGTTLAICLCAFTVVFINGVNLRHVLTILAGGAALGTALIYSADYRYQRFTSFLNPGADPLGAGWQINQSMMAFGSGGLLGIGLAMGRQKYFYLPAAHTDFIFAIIGEELGLVGTLFTLALFAIFAYYGIKISFNAKDRFSKLLGAGITSMIALQAIINMGAVTAILPVTGIPMPFISYGGSSLMVNLAAIGMLLGIAVEGEREKKSKQRTSSETDRRSHSSRYSENEFAEIVDLKSAKSTKKRGSRKSDTKKTTAKNASKSTSKKVSKNSSGSSRSKRAIKADSNAKSKKHLKPVDKSIAAEKSARNSHVKKQKKTSIAAERVSELAFKTRTQKRQEHASNNKRGRDGGSRVSRSGARQSSQKNKE